MRKSLGFVFGFILGAIAFAVGGVLAQSQPWNPYAPGSFNSSTNLQQAIISADTDAYLNSMPRYSSPNLSLGNPCPR